MENSISISYSSSSAHNNTPGRGARSKYVSCRRCSFLVFLFQLIVPFLQFTWPWLRRWWPRQPRPYPEPWMVASDLARQGFPLICKPGGGPPGRGSDRWRKVVGRRVPGDVRCLSGVRSKLSLVPGWELFVACGVVFYLDRGLQRVTITTSWKQWIPPEHDGAGASLSRQQPL